MQLLPSRASPGPEFASISLLLKGDMFGDTQKSTGRMVEPLLLPSSVSAISQTTCIEAVQELHHYINSILQARSSTSTTTTTTTTTTSKMATALLQEDEQRLLSNNNNNNDIQVFRPLKGQGIGLHYRLLRDRSTMSTLIPLVFNSSKANNAANNKGVEKDVTGVIVCIGITGLPSMLHMSSLHYSLSQRLQDCLEILTKSSNNSSTTSSSSSSSMENGGGDGIMACKTLLTTLLLTEDEDRFSNTMAGGFHRTVLSDITRADSTQGALALKMKMKKSQDHNTTMVEEEDFSFFTHSADLARIMVERLAVLSVAENDTIFRKFETRTGEKEGKKGKLRKRKTGRDADLDGFDFKGEKRSSSSMNESSKSSMSSATSLTSESTSSSMTKASSISSSSSKLQLKQPKGDTRSRMLGKGVGKQTSVPALLASSRDGRSRRASIAGIDMNSARKNLKANRRLSSGHDWSFDTTNNSFATAQSARNLPQNHDSDSLSAKTPPGSINSRGTRSRPSNDNFDPFASNHMSGDTAAGSENSLSTHMDQFGGSDAFDSRGDMMLSGQRSIQSSGHSSLGSESNNGPKLQISIALNEDLTCFYKLSKMSSCNVEGVLQVQVKSNTEQGGPFFLLVKDPSKHLQSIQENKKFADNMTDSLRHEHPTSRPDYKFTISVPKADSYFPVMRYKCGDELRPVPIRVQTRVRSEDAHWRVALQISSNPHNEDSLTDLTIIMGVPPSVRGESLTTSPPGGVWNASKRSVIWCVSELGGGEKFQLQARFEVEPDAPDSGDEKPKFPVLVRCQCMYAQLSDIEVEVRDIPEVFPADINMKLGRRFRLSHRERP